MGETEGSAGESMKGQPFVKHNKAIEQHCYKCGQTKPLSEFTPQMYQCRECVRLYCRERYAKDERFRASKNAYAIAKACSKDLKKEWQKFKSDPAKVAAHRAHALVWDAIHRTGKLIRPETCSECGSKSHRIEAHHEDHSKPLEVKWLCSWCHGRTRRKPIGIILESKSKISG